jgi:Tfp pilus assembly protein PilO
MKNINITVNGKNKIILSLLTTIIFSGGIFYFVILKSLAAIQDTEDKIIINKMDLDKKYISSISQKQFMSKMKMVESQMQKIDSIFINKNRMLDFVTALEGLASQDQIEQKINMADAPVTSSGPVKNSISLTAHGSLKNVLIFLEDVESLSYYININTLDMQKTPDGVYLNFTSDIYVK